jgi:hypothetical protein
MTAVITTLGRVPLALRRPANARNAGSHRLGDTRWHVQRLAH